MPGQQVVNQAGEVIGTLVENTPAIEKGIQTVEQTFVHGGKVSFNTRSLEKLLAYGAGLVAATNGFAQLALPNSVRVGLMAVSSAVVFALHHSSVKT